MATEYSIVVLEAALKVMQDELNDFVDACIDDHDRPCAPSRKALMRARSMLPPRCRLAFHTKETANGDRSE